MTTPDYNRLGDYNRYDVGRPPADYQSGDQYEQLRVEKFYANHTPQPMTTAQYKHNPMAGHSDHRHMRKIRISIIIAVSAIAVLVVALIVIALHPSSSTSLSVVKQPPSASQVAQQFGCTGFVDEGASTVGGVVDSGTCTKNGVKYAIATFLSSDIMTNWLKVAEPLGVIPLQKSDTAIIYKSTKK